MGGELIVSAAPYRVAGQVLLLNCWSLYINLCNCLILICSIQHQMKVDLWTKKQLQALANELVKNLKTPEDLSQFDWLLKKAQR